MARSATRMACSMTSGPMPSPAMTAIRCVAMKIRSFGKMGKVCGRVIIGAVLPILARGVKVGTPDADIRSWSVNRGAWIVKFVNDPQATPGRTGNELAFSSRLEGWVKMANQLKRTGGRKRMGRLDDGESAAGRQSAAAFRTTATPATRCWATSIGRSPRRRQSGPAAIRA